MTLKLSSALLEAAYEFLRVTPPFDRWAMPDGEDISFIVTRNPSKRGEHIYPAAPHNGHEIRISEVNSGHTINVLMTMAHEMVHLHQTHAKTPGRRSEHGAEFKRFAAQVCRHHGFDVKAF